LGILQLFILRFSQNEIS